MDATTTAAAAASSSADPSWNGNNKRRKLETAQGADEMTATATECPYLDTINRSLLDFDFEPACSVSMEVGPHIYGCLVCGKYFRGRAPNTPAYTHSVEESHFVWVHLANATFHCLPDGYVVDDPSLQDIRDAIRPPFSPQRIARLDVDTNLCRDLFGRRYLPGFVGLNNLNKTDCLNAIVQALAHVPPLRDYFLKRQVEMDKGAVGAVGGGPSKGGASASASSVSASSSSHHRMSRQVAYAFGELLRKIWSDRRFKSHVDPHMLVQAVSVASKKKFGVGKQAEAGEVCLEGTRTCWAFSNSFGYLTKKSHLSFSFSFQRSVLCSPSSWRFC